MPGFVALLRGINVGKANRISMADLRALLLRLGYADVSTLLNSGNLVFRTGKGPPARHAATIAAALSDVLKIEVPVVAKSANQLSAIVAENPFAAQASNPSQLLVVFAQNRSALAGLGSIESMLVPPEQFRVGRHAAYLHCAAGIRPSKAAAALLGKTGRSFTTRNWATVLKLHASLAEAAGVRPQRGQK